MTLVHRVHVAVSYVHVLLQYEIICVSLAQYRTSQVILNWAQLLKMILPIRLFLSEKNSGWMRPMGCQWKAWLWHAEEVLPGSLKPHFADYLGLQIHGKLINSVWWRYCWVWTSSLGSKGSRVMVEYIMQKCVSLCMWYKPLLKGYKIKDN